VAGTFFKVGGTSARQKHYRKVLWFQLVTVTSQALEYDVITYTPCEGLNYTILDKITPLWKPGAARQDGLQPSLKNVRQKIPPNGQTRLKIGLSYEVSQHNHFRYFRHHFGSTFPMNPTKPMFRSFPTTPLMRWRFQHTCWWIWRFRGCLRYSPEGNKPNNWLQETWWYIHLSQSVFVILKVNFWRQNGGNMILTVFYYLIFLEIEFIIKFNNAFTSTLAILAALDSNPVANLGLRKYSPSFICTSAACNCGLSWWTF